MVPRIHESCRARDAAVQRPYVGEKSVIGWRAFSEFEANICGRLAPLGCAEAHPHNSQQVG
jgi:hypothetical protein